MNILNYENINQVVLHTYIYIYIFASSLLYVDIITRFARIKYYNILFS